MTVTILLVRHAAHTQLDRVLSGRVGDVPLSAAGLDQARKLARRLGREGLSAVQTSPVRRARATAQAIASLHGLIPEVTKALDEIDFGEWSGKRFVDLSRDPRWTRWNTHRAEVVPPGGEAMAEAQERALAHLRLVARHASDLVVAMISHADMIRATVAGILGLSLNRILSFDIDPGSITRIEAGDWGERLVTLNERGFA